MRTVGLLLVHIDRLKALHKAGIPAQAGDVEQLWDLAAEVRAECASAAIGPIPGAAVSLSAPVAVRIVAEVLDAAGAVARRIPVGGEN
jgi:hypothetical protein